MALKHARHGFVLYANVLYVVTDGPCTTGVIARRCGITLVSAQRLMRRMYDLKMVHIASWLPPRLDANATPLWRAGKKPDAPRPPAADGNVAKKELPGDRRVRPCTNLVAFAAMVAALRSQPISYRDLADETGTSADTVRRLLNYLHDVLRLVFIGDWGAQPGRTPERLFRYGFRRPDAPGPEPVPALVCAAKYRERQRGRRRSAFVFQLVGKNAGQSNTGA